MISECVMWVGIYTSTYQDEIDTWLGETDDLDKSVMHCDEIWLDDDNDLFIDTGGMFSDKVVLFLGAEKWSSGEAQWVLRKYSEMTGDVKVGLVFQGGDPAKKVAEYATEEVRVRRIPYDSNDMADWIVSWLRKRKVIIDRDDAYAVAEHVRYDIGQLVQAITLISSGLTKGNRAQRDEILGLLGPLGETDLQDLTNGIIAGDRPATAEAYQRLAHMGAHYLFHILSNRMRAYCALAYNKSIDLTLFGFYGGAQYYIKKEAKLTEKQSLQVLRLTADYERRLKGFADGLSNEDAMILYTDSLASVFSRRRR